MVTWLCVLLTWLVAYCFLDDLTVIDTNDPEEDEATQRQNSTDISTLEDSEGYVSNGDIHIIPAKAMIKPHILRKWFPSYYQTMHIEEENNDTAAVGRQTIKCIKHNTELLVVQEVMEERTQLLLLVYIINSVSFSV